MVISVKRLKRNEMIILYLFTAALVLVGIKRFSVEEQISVLPVDGDRVSDYSLVAEKIVVYEDAAEVFSFAPVFNGNSLPLSDGKMTSDFGYRTDPFGDEQIFHSGTDIAVPLNTDVYAVCEGVVVYAGYDEIGGNSVRIRHGNGFESYYGHLSEFTVSVGDEISEGQRIGSSGDSGKVTGAHLHFGLFYKGSPVDPEVYLNFDKYSQSSER